jgi:K+-sensing histidine kinase KdpD
MNFFSTVYALLLAYIVAALVFWGLSLYKQSERIYEQEMLHLRTQIDSTTQSEQFNIAKAQFNDKRLRRIKQYTGEGSTFLLIILIGAGIVYSSYRRGNKLSKQQNNFMLSVTHELKSPIAAMKLNLQTLEKHQLDETKKQLLIEKCILESNRLNDLCNNILMASQMEGKQHKPVFEQMDFCELIQHTANAYLQRYPKRFVDNLQVNKAFINGDKLMLQMAVNNLIENALKYSADQVFIHTFVKKQQLYFRVADQGAGVPDSEKQKIFRKFYRVGNEETRTSKGTGLGLYLTEKIIREHGGKITVKDNKPNGAVFEMEIPLA